MKRLGQCANRKGGILKDKVLMAGQTGGQIVRREKLMVDREVSNPSDKQVEAFDKNDDGRVMGSEIKATFSDKMSKDMGGKTLYKKYCRTGRK